MTDTPSSDYASTLPPPASMGELKRAKRQAARKRAFVKAKQAREDRARKLWERMTGKKPHPSDLGPDNT